MVSKCRAATGRSGVAYQTVTAVARPPHHAVNVTATLRGDGAVERGVRGGTVPSCSGRNTFRKTKS